MSPSLVPQKKKFDLGNFMRFGLIGRFCAATLLGISCELAFAQTTLIEGRVTDSLGGAINGAVVTVISPETAAQTTRTGADGTFSLDAAPAGAVTLRFEAAGFEASTQTVTPTATAPPMTVVLQITGVVESVGVVAPRLEEDLPQIIEQSGVRLQTITSAQIQNGGYYDVAQALQALVPGLFLTPRAGPFDYVTASLEGSRTNEILWLVDGVRISNRLYNGTTPLDTIPAHMVERIEILEGGQGLFYGTQAVAGVINVVTRAFSERTSATLQGGGNTNGGGFASGLARGTVHGNRFVIYGSTDDAKGFQPFPEAQYQTSTTDRNRSYDVLTFGGKYAYDFSQQLRVTAAYQFTNAGRLDNLQPARSSLSQSGGPSNVFNERNENILSAKVDFAPRKTVDLFFKSYYHQWDSHYTEERNVIGGAGAADVVSDREFWGYKDYGANLLARLTPNRGLEYLAGYDFQNYSGQDDVLLIAANTERVNAIFGQIRTNHDLLHNVALTAGVRYNAPTTSETHTAWNVTGQYDFAKSFFARATAGTSFRYPDAYELFAIDPTCCFGNPDLKPESSTNFNGSFGGRLQPGAATVDLEVVAFYRQISNLIVDTDDGTGSGNTITANSDDTVRVHGFSLLGSASLNPALTALVGYTYTTSEQGNTLAGGYSSLPGLPSNRVNASADFHPVRKPFGGSLTVFWVGEIIDNVSGFGKVPSGNYTATDLAGRYFLDARRQHRLNVRLENLFDAEYATGHGRGFPDLGGTQYLTSTLGMPRSLHISYTFAY
jgi:vitamin B12 transporter